MLVAYRTIERTIMAHTRAATGVLRVSMIVRSLDVLLDADDRERRVAALLSLHHGVRQTDFDHVLSISIEQEMILT